MMRMHSTEGSLQLLIILQTVNFLSCTEDNVNA